MQLSEEQAHALSILFPYQELEKRRVAGHTLSFSEKQIILESKVEPFIAMIRGEYSKEDLNKLCAKWRVFFKVYYPDVFNEGIRHIESIQRQIQLSN